MNTVVSITIYAAVCPLELITLLYEISPYSYIMMIM